MRLIVSPESYTKHRGERSLFLAGGITGCPDWQSYVINGLVQEDLVLLNPRRVQWDMSANQEESIAQIAWEHEHLQMADEILFWFPKETLCPITLLEYGKYMMSNKRLIVGTHPEYQRRFDIIAQTQLERPGVIIYDNLDDLIKQAITPA